MRQIHVLLTLTDDDAQALAFAKTSADDFVQATRRRWEFEKRNAHEMYATIQREARSLDPKAGW